MTILRKLCKLAYKLTHKKCKYCVYHKENACLMNIGVWRDDNYCSLWKKH